MRTNGWIGGALLLAGVLVGCGCSGEQTMKATVSKPAAGGAAGAKGAQSGSSTGGGTDVPMPAGKQSEPTPEEPAKPAEATPAATEAAPAGDAKADEKPAETEKKPE